MYPLTDSREFHESIVTYRYETQLANAFALPSSIPLPASGYVCEPPLPLALPPALPQLGVLGAVFALRSGLALAAAIVPAPRIAPGLAPPSLGLNNLLKKSWDASCSVLLDGLPSIGSVDVGAPARLPSVLLPSISAEACSAVGSEYDDKPKGSTKPATGATGSAEDTAGLRSGRSRRRSARGTLILASGCWGVGEGPAARREEKGQEASSLRTYLVHVTRDAYIFPATESLSESIPSCFTRSRRAIPRSGPNRPNPQPAGTTMRTPSSVFGLCERKGMGYALVLRYRRVCRWGKGLEIQITHGAHIGRTLKGHRLRCRVGEACGEK